MKLLALDTSSDACSVALQIGDDVFEQHVVQPREHTNILIPMIQTLMRKAGVEIGAMDAIVLGNGPGSFIGMRIAASVAQGLAFGSGLKIVPISSMAAVAAEVLDAHREADVVVAQDARMNQVYLGIYRDDGDGLPVAVAEETLQGVARIDGLPGSRPLAAGKGWIKYAQLLDLNRENVSELVDVPYPRARYLLGLGAKGLGQGQSIEPENLVPRYIRVKVAEKPVQA